MNASIRVELASPPDRERLVAQIMIGNEQWAEVSQEADVLELEVYAKQDGQPWKMTLDDALDILAAARERLKA